MLPMITKAYRQLYWTIRKTMTGGAIAPPNEVPTLYQPTAIERSLAGNHSCEALRPPGMTADSLTPRRPRKKAKENQPPTKA
jgi:hypothetical protein